MSSAKQIAANRKNAQKSKGPRTAAGKARASCNSRKHTLTTISRNHPLYAPRIEAIARAICPNTTNAGLWEQALIIGECTTVLACVQAERIASMEQAFWQNEPKIPQSGIRWANAAAAERKAELGAAELGAAEFVSPRDELGATDLAARDLDRLERYQRRALSRRKRAIETFMAISNTLPMRHEQTTERPHAKTIG